jgi:hypothetical protein
MEVRCHTPSTVDPVLAVADSEGGVNLVRWSTSEVFCRVRTGGNSSDPPKRQAAHLQKIACGSTDTLCLSLDWDSRHLSSRYAAYCSSMGSFG